MQARSKWPIAAGLAAEALGGCVVGLAGAALFGFAGARLFANTSNGWGDLIAAILGAMIGYTVAVSLGVYLIGRRLSGRGSYWPALVGSVAAEALVLLAAEPLRLNANTAVLQTMLVAIPPILATLGFNLSLKARK
jgi:hypothetical protein